MQIKLDTKELSVFAKALANESDKLRTELKKAMVSSVLDVQTTAKKPGYVPLDTGNLRRSITHDPVKFKGNGIVGIIGSNLDYAAIHEFGGKTGRNHSITIKPKRYLQRAIEDNEDKIKDRFKRLLAGGLIR